MFLFFIFASHFFYEEKACHKAKECTWLHEQHMPKCVMCVDQTYTKYKYMVPFTKKQVFEYVLNLSCEDLRKKMEFYEIFSCILK